MKKLTKFALLLLCGAFTFGFTACSDDDDDNNNGTARVTMSASEVQTAFNNYIDNIVYENYEALQSAAETLHEKCAALYAKKQAGDVSQADIDSCCAWFKIARRQWEQSEAFLYGPATDDGLDPHTDSWPLDQTEMANALTNAGIIAALNGDNAAEYLDQHNDDFQSTLGYHGLEFILFRNGANRTAEAFNKEYEDAEGLNPNGDDSLTVNQTKLRTVTTLNEAAFANAVSEDLRNATHLLAYEWDGNATLKNFITTNCNWYWNRSIYTNASHDFTYGKSYGERIRNVGSGFIYDSYQNDFSNILLGGCQSICQEVHTQKLGQAYRVATGSGEGEDAINYIESPYSKRSFQDYQDNIYGIRNVLYGVRGTRNAAVSNNESAVTPAANSLMAILNKYYTAGYTGTAVNEDESTTTVTGNAAALQQALTNALQALENAKNSGTAFVDDPDNAQVLTCINAVRNLDYQLQIAAQWLTADVDMAQ